MAPPASYLVAVLCCICVPLTSNIVPSFSLPGVALRHRDLNPPPNVIGQFLEREDVVREGTEEDGSDFGAEFLDETSKQRQHRDRHNDVHRQLELSYLTQCSFLYCHRLFSQHQRHTAA